MRSKAELIAEIQYLAKNDPDGMAISSLAPSRIRQEAIIVFGGWENACKAAGVRCPSMEKQKSVLGEIHHAEQLKMDLSQGILVKMNESAVCLSCMWATGGGNCSWVREFIIPKGAIYYEKKLKIDGYRTRMSPIIIYCPNYIKG